MIAGANQAASAVIQNPQLILRLRSDREESITRAALEELNQFAQQNPGDPLSNSIVRWIIDLQKEIADARSSDDLTSTISKIQDIIENYRKKLPQLLITNYNVFLNDPVIDTNGHVWNRNDWEKYRAEFGTDESPFLDTDKKVDRVEEHQFAKKLIELCQKYLGFVTPTPQEWTEERRDYLNTLLLCKQEIQQNEKLKAKCKEHQAKLKKATQKSEANAKECERYREELARASSKVLERVDQIRADYHTVIKMLNKRIEELTKELSTLKNAYYKVVQDLAAAKSKQKELEEEIERLKQEVANLSFDDGGGSSCTIL